MRVLYAAHTALVSGAERSLLELLLGLPPDVEPLLACPPGPLADEVIGSGIGWAPLPATAGSLKLHPVHTPVALAELGRIALRLRRIARTAHVDLIHANTLQVALAAGLARPSPPLVVHVRDCLPNARAGRLVRRWIDASADALIGISRFTADCWGPGVDTVIPNAVDTGRFDPAAADNAGVRAELAIPGVAPVLAIVAQITPWKGQLDAIEAFSLIRRQHPHARLLVVGEPKFVFASTRYDNTAYLEELHAAVERLGLAGSVYFLGERADVPDVMAAADLLLVPSWEEPFGRTIIEAMAMGVPAVATAAGGPSEIIDDGDDGVLLPPREPSRWAVVASELLGDRERLAQMGERGRRKARERYSRAAHVERVVEVYRHLV